MPPHQAWQPPFQGMDASSFKLEHPSLAYARTAFARAGGPIGNRGVEGWLLGRGRALQAYGSVSALCLHPALWGTVNCKVVNICICLW